MMWRGKNRPLPLVRSNYYMKLMQYCKATQLCTPCYHRCKLSTGAVRPFLPQLP